MLIGPGLLGLVSFRRKVLGRHFSPTLVRHAKQSCLMAGIGAPGAAMASREAQRFRLAA